jgi:hypothetical protein
MKTCIELYGNPNPCERCPCALCKENFVCNCFYTLCSNQNCKYNTRNKIPQTFKLYRYESN